MKNKLLQFSLPVGLGLLLTSITMAGLLSTTLSGCLKKTSCLTGHCMGTDGNCYQCSSGSYCTITPSGTCSVPNHGVYCCTGSGGGGGGCNPTGCPSSTPWLCGGYCYATPPSGNHACIKCP